MFQPLTTGRLLVDPLAAADVDAFVAWRRVPEVARWQGWDVDYSEADARALVAGQPTTPLPPAGMWLQLAIRSRDRSELHGDLGLHCLADQPDTFEVGITLAPAAQGQGIATEALARLLDHLFDDHAAHRVIARCDARNDTVTRLLGRVGMRQESRQVDGDWFGGEWTTLDGHAILARERLARLGGPASEQGPR